MKTIIASAASTPAAAPAETISRVGAGAGIGTVAAG